MSVAHFVAALLAALVIGLTFIVVAAMLFLAFCECTNWAATRYSIIGVQHSHSSRKPVAVQRPAA